MALTEKQERFCLAYLELGNASEAYRRAYDASRMKEATVNKRASELLKDGEITGRLAELRRPVVEKAQHSLEQHLARLDHLSKAAEEKGMYDDAIKAEVKRGEALGYYINRQEVRTTGIHTEPLSVTEQWIKKVLSEGAESHEHPKPN